jgi:hypothetical protein
MAALLAHMQPRPPRFVHKPLDARDAARAEGAAAWKLRCRQLCLARVREQRALIIQRLRAGGASDDPRSSMADSLQSIIAEAAAAAAPLAAGPVAAAARRPRPAAMMDEGADEAPRPPPPPPRGAFPAAGSMVDERGGAGVSAAADEEDEEDDEDADVDADEAKHFPAAHRRSGGGGDGAPWEGLDYDEFMSLMRELEREVLAEEDARGLEAHARLDQEALAAQFELYEAARLLRGGDAVLCPLCMRCALRLAPRVDLLACRCGLRLKLQEPLAADAVRAALSAAYEAHALTGCAQRPRFAVMREGRGDAALFVACARCDWLGVALQ